MTCAYPHSRGKTVNVTIINVHQISMYYICHGSFKAGVRDLLNQIFLLSLREAQKITHNSKHLHYPKEKELIYLDNKYQVTI